jgi:uncharacterized protein YqgC (DUF456 family)
MIEIGAPLLITLTLVAMFASLFLILIPSVPVSALEWAIALVFGVLTGFERFTPVAAVSATIFMLIGATSGLWMPLLGMRGRSISCMGMVAFFIGMIAGSALIPVPFLGTIIGGVIGVMLVEYMRSGNKEATLESGRSAFKLVIYGMVAEFIFATAVIVTTIVSIVTTG